MRKDLLILALGLFAAAGTAAGDDLAVPDAQTEAPAEAMPRALPAKGITMKAVRKQFGEPRDKHGPVGGDTPKHPPITRWNYDGFIVVFENDRVIDAVVPGAPPKLRTTAGLTAATNAPPPPMAPAMPMETPAEPVPEAEPAIPEAPAETPPPAMEPTAEAPAEAPPAEAPPAEAPPAETAPAEEPPALAPPPAEPAVAEPEQFPEDDRPPTPK
jgi:hypothetical protein